MQGAKPQGWIIALSRSAQGSVEMACNTENNNRKEPTRKTRKDKKKYINANAKQVREKG